MRIMSVLTYLDTLASKLNLTTEEKGRISTSLTTLQSRLNSHFGDDLASHFVFGSYTRGTILPRKADKYSDIDYMVIFKNPKGYKPQTLLNYLKTFAETKYN